MDAYGGLSMVWWITKTVNDTQGHKNGGLPVCVCVLERERKPFWSQKATAVSGLWIAKPRSVRYFCVCECECVCVQRPQYTKAHVLIHANL